MSELDEATVDATLGAVLKYREDQERVRQQHGVADIVKQAFERGASSAADERAPVRRPRRRREAIADRVRPACCAGSGSACRSACVLDFTEALGAVGLERPRRRVLGGAVHALRRPEDLPLFDRAFAVFWDARAAPIDDEDDRARSCASRSTIDDDERRRRRRRRDAEPSDDPTIQLRFSRGRGAAPEGLRRVRRRRAAPRPGS